MAPVLEPQRRLADPSVVALDEDDAATGLSGALGELLEEHHKGLVGASFLQASQHGLGYEARDVTTQGSDLANQ